MRFQKILHTAILCCLTAWVIGSEAIPLGGVGYRYDGAGLVPADWKPPAQGIDVASKKGLRWRIPTGNWGYACPVEIGDQVLVMCEPGSEDMLWPTLVSYDRLTGKEKWRTAIDPLLPHNLSAGDRKQVEDDWRFFHETWRFLYQTAVGYDKADESGRAAINKKLQTRQFTIEKWKKGYGLLRYLKNNNARFKEVSRKYAKPYGFKSVTWHEFEQARVGACFPTPVTDGEHIVVITMYGTVACLDMQGAIKWIHDTGYREPGNAGTGSSPRIAGGKALFNMSSQSWAYDIKTGKQAWTVGKPGDKWINGHGVYASPVVMDLNGTLVFIDGKSRVIRIKDGSLMKLVDGDGKELTGTQGKKKIPFSGRISNPNYLPFGVDRAKQEIFICGKSHLPQFELKPFPDHFKKMKQPSLVGYSLQSEGDVVTVEPTTLQVLPAPGGVGASQGGVAYGDKLYIPGRIIDRQTLDGADAHKKAPNRAAVTRHIFMLGNKHTYGMKEEWKRGSSETGNELTIYNLEGKMVTKVLLPWISPKKDPNVQKVWDQGITKTNYAGSFNLGKDAIYARDNAYLYSFAR